MKTAMPHINFTPYAPTTKMLQSCTVAVLFALLTACHSGPTPAQCIANTGTYQDAKNNPALKIPAGAETPDHRNALNIPPDTGKALEPTRCLEVAPNYFGIAARIAASPEEMVADWAQAWADRNSDVVMSMYATSFIVDGVTSSTEWRAQRTTDIKQSPLPAPRVSDLKISQVNDDQRLATFSQQFGKTALRKELTLVRESGLWKISRERTLSTP